MSRNDRIITVAREWVTKAENDLKAASHILKIDKDCPADTVCFHAQQCVEKYLKAILSLKSIDFPKTHNLKKLIALLPMSLRPGLTPEEQGTLTNYATFMRYPGDYEPVSLTEARRAVRITRRVRTAIRKLLPRKALRRRRS